MVTRPVHGPQRARVELDPRAQRKLEARGQRGAGASAAGGGCLMTLCAMIVAVTVLVAALGLTV